MYLHGDAQVGKSSSHDLKARHRGSDNRAAWLAGTSSKPPPRSNLGIEHHQDDIPDTPPPVGPVKTPSSSFAPPFH